VTKRIAARSSGNADLFGVTSIGEFEVAKYKKNVQPLDSRLSQSWVEPTPRELFEITPLVG
jgi:hypothetical protein